MYSTSGVGTPASQHEVPRLTDEQHAHHAMDMLIRQATVGQLDGKQAEVARAIGAAQAHATLAVYMQLDHLTAVLSKTNELLAKMLPVVMVKNPSGEE